MDVVAPRFFQLSKDSINFARTVISTAAVVAVITPFPREGLEFAADTFLRRQCSTQTGSVLSRLWPQPTGIR